MRDDDLRKAEQAVIAAADFLNLQEMALPDLDTDGRYHGFTDLFTTGHDLWALRDALIRRERVLAGETYTEPEAPCDCREGLWSRFPVPPPRVGVR